MPNQAQTVDLKGDCVGSSTKPSTRTGLRKSGQSVVFVDKEEDDGIPHGVKKPQSTSTADSISGQLHKMKTSMPKLSTEVKSNEEEFVAPAHTEGQGNSGSTHNGFSEIFFLDF